jgi:hypothetical protein
MSFNPIESVKAVFPGEMLNKMAGILGGNYHQCTSGHAGYPSAVMIGIILRTEFGDAFDTLNLSKKPPR